MENINMLRFSSRGNILNHLAVPNTKEFRNISWDHVISLTSHPARFATLEIALEQLLNQHLIPKKIYLNIAQSDLDQLPSKIKELESGGIVKINACSDLGPGKKLIPTLKLEQNLPIIVVDDDLFFETDLTMKLMVQHHLSPKNIVASRFIRLFIKLMEPLPHIVSGLKITPYQMVLLQNYFQHQVLERFIRKSFSIRM